MTGCLIDGCRRKHKARGLCDSHYEKWRRGKLDIAADVIPPAETKPCSVPGCQRRAFGRSLCEPHQQRVLKHGDVQAHIPIRQAIQDDECSVDGCDRPTDARGWCRAHYGRWQRYGDVQADRPLGYRQISHDSSCAVCEEIGFMSQMAEARELYARLGFPSIYGLEQHVRRFCPEFLPWVRRSMSVAS